MTLQGGLSGGTGFGAPAIKMIFSQSQVELCMKTTHSVEFTTSLPEDGDVLDGAADGRAILLGGLSPLAFPGGLGTPCLSMIQGGDRPDGSQGTRPSPLPHNSTTLRAF